MDTVGVINKGQDNCEAWAEGKTYAVERSTDLVTWKTISEGIPATAPVNTLTDYPLNLPRVFYRVRPQ